MTAPADIYQVASGQPIYGGRAAPSTVPPFDSVPVSFPGSANTGIPYGNQFSLPVGVELHGSGGANNTTGTQYRAAVSGAMALAGVTSNRQGLDFDSRSTFGFSVATAYQQDRVVLRPIDKWGNDAGTFKEGYHIGFVLSDGRLHLVDVHRYDAMVDYARRNLTAFDWTRAFATGGSMGGWATASYALRRAQWFAAIYPDRPRWNCTNVSLPQWEGQYPSTTYTSANAPLLAPEDGGGSSFDYLNCVAFVSNLANKVPFTAWCAGRQDGYAGDFNDQILMMDAMEAAGRPYAFYWNNGGHEAGSSMDKIVASYPWGFRKLGEGMPLYSAFSRNQDPRVHIAGGRNIGLKYRNVVETSTGWSCDVTCMTPTTTTGNVFAGDQYTAFSSSTTSCQLPVSESEIPDVYVGGTITIGGETRTISAYTPVGIDPNDGAHDRKKPAIVTVSSPFSVAPAANAAYSITRPDIACTVTVKPYSEVFKATVVAQTKTIPATGTWVPFSFSA
jgi:hypothetical protein